MHATLQVPPLPRLTVLFLAILAAACESNDLVGPAAEECGSGPYFTALPVSMVDIDAITVIGGLGAPGHTLPTAHAGVYLATEGALVHAPGDMQITGLRRTRYLVSPVRQGEEDYTADFQVCRQVSGWFGHLTSLSSGVPVPESNWGNCQQYSTATETVQTCRASLSEVTLEASEPLGTGGLSIALGLMGLDFGLLDTRVNNFYVAPSRHPTPTFQSVCPWDQFESALRTQLYSKLRDKSRPFVEPEGEPRCGTMSVDVAGTAAGVWVIQGVQPTPGNETTYITLARYPYRPQSELALSLGPDQLGAKVAVVPRLTGGRVNRPFDEVVADGLIYCYGPDVMGAPESWLLRLTAAATLEIRREVHAAGASPCIADASTWSVAGGMTMVR
jgi:hypothetical protein